MPIRQIQTAQFDVVNPVTMQLVKKVAALKEAPNIGVFGDLIQGNTNSTVVGFAVFAPDCTDIPSLQARYAQYQTLFTLEKLYKENPQNMQLFAVLADQLILNFTDTGWSIAKVSRRIRSRITVNSVPVTDFCGEVASVVQLPDWAHVLINKLTKLPESINLRLFGSAVTLDKEPADLDVAVMVNTDDWNDAQDVAADLLFDLLNLHANTWLGDRLDLYVCLTDNTYHWNPAVGDWTPVHDGQQLAAAVRKQGVGLSVQTAGISNKTPHRRRIKTDPEHRSQRLKYKKDMKNPANKRHQKRVRKLYVRKNKSKLQRKADQYTAWRDKQSF